MHHAIAYASKIMTGAQLNYASTEKELLAIVFAIDKFRSYLVLVFLASLHIKLSSLT